MPEIKKIVVIGPESTGKSTLCRLLSTHYNSLWCPEYAREYLLRHGTDYSYDDLLTIAKGQIALEDEYTGKAKEIAETNSKKPASGLLFVDTDMYVMKVWCEYVFGNCHQYILNKIIERKPDLYLLCNIDLAWVKDELREYPDLKSREELYHTYKDILVNEKIPWRIISGDYQSRLQLAVKVIDEMFT